jgi:hypothetical protein
MPTENQKMNYRRYFQLARGLKGQFRLYLLLLNNPVHLLLEMMRYTDSHHHHRHHLYLRRYRPQQLQVILLCQYTVH